MESKMVINVNCWSIMWVVLINKKKLVQGGKQEDFLKLQKWKTILQILTKKVSKNGLLVSVSYNHPVIIEYISNNY